MNRKKWYCGHLKSGYLIAFPSDITNEKTFQEKYESFYAAVIGPFRTKRAALWAEKYGSMNPHFQHVEDAERISKIGGGK
jgi:hypothetical protein